jgi:type IV secretory pathway VirB2 component (pilin)
MKMFKGNFPLAALVTYLTITLLLFVDTAVAAGMSSSPLPMNTALQTIRDFFTGTFAWTISIVSLVVSIGTLAFGGADFGGGARIFIFLAIILSAVVFANNLMSTWFAGAVI